MVRRNVTNIMLKRIFALCLVFQLVSCAHIHHSLYDQDLSLPQKTISCGDLRKQFENGYIRLKEFLDQIRNCKESPHERHKHRHLRHRIDNNGHRDRNSQYTYTDYLVPVLRSGPDSSHFTSATNDFKPTTSDFKNHQSMPPVFQNFANPTMPLKGQESSTFIPSLAVTRPKQKTINGVVVDSAAGQLILKAMLNGELPGVSPINLASNVGQENTNSFENPPRNGLETVAGNQRFSVLSPDKSNNNDNNNNIKNNNINSDYNNNKNNNNNNNGDKSSSSLLGELQSDGHSENWSDYFQYRNLLNNLGYDRNLFSQQRNSVDAIDKNLIRSQLIPQVSNFFGQQSPPASKQFSSLLDSNIPQLSESLASPTSARDSFEPTLSLLQNNELLSQTSNFELPTKSTAEELESINEELRDDVSLLHESTGGIRPLSLFQFESFAPQIIESIAARSKINGESLLKKKETNSTAVKRIFSEATSNSGNNAAKDILDIKYTQLEDKLINDLKRRQAILQKLEQESMVQHFAQPGSIPLSKLSDVFKSINDETAEKTMTRLQAQSVRKNQNKSSPDDLGLFMPISNPSGNSQFLTNQKPPLQNDASSYSTLKYLEDHLPHNFALSNFRGKLLAQHRHDLKRFENDRLANMMLHEDRHTRLNRHKGFTDGQSDKTQVKSNITKDINNTNIFGKIANMTSFKLDNNKNNTRDDQVGNRRTNIPAHPEEKDTKVPFSRKVLFTNKFFNDVIRAAMKRKSSVPNKENQVVHRRIQKKSVIYGSREKSFKSFNADILQTYNENFLI